MPTYIVGIYKVATRHEVVVSAPDTKTASNEAIKLHKAGKSQAKKVDNPEMVVIQEKK